MSTSAEGSVKGKWLARKRSSTRFDLEEGAAEFLQRPFQVGHRDVAVDGQALDLVEHRRVRLVIVAAIDAAGRDDAAGGAVRLEMADLHRRGVGAQDVARAVRARRHVERVHLGARRVLGGDVQRVEIVPVGLDVRAFGDGKAHLGEDRRQLVRDLADRMDRALRRRAGRERDVQPLGAQPLVERRVGQRRLARRDGGVDLVLQRVEGGAGGLALVGRHAAELAHHQRDLALLAQRRDAHRLDRRLVGGVGDLPKVPLPDRLRIVHPSSRLRAAPVLAGPRAARPPCWLAPVLAAPGWLARAGWPGVSMGRRRANSGGRTGGCGQRAVSGCSGPAIVVQLPRRPSFARSMSCDPPSSEMPR